MFPTVVEVGECLKDCLIFVVRQNDELKIRDLMARFTTDVIGTCAFCIESNGLKDSNAEFRYYGCKAFEKPQPLTFMFLRGFARKLHIKNVCDDVSEFFFFINVVYDTVEYREKNYINRNDFMEILIKLKNEEKIVKIK